MTRARIVRRVVVAVCVIGIAGMIVGSVGDDNGVALTFGLVTAAAVLCLMVSTAVAQNDGFDETQGARVERLVEALVAKGVPEEDLRALVGEAVKLGRSRPFGREIPHIGAPDADD